MANQTTPAIQIKDSNVGIGTVSPIYKLDIVGTDDITPEIRIGNSSSKTAFIGFSSTYGFDVDAGGVGGNYLNLKGGANGSTGGITFSTFGLERMRIDYTGNVGIGTSSPSQKLEVSGGNAQFNGGGIDGNLGEAILFGNTTYSTSFKNRIRSSISASTNGNLLSLEAGTATVGVYNNNQLVLRGDGNVGIGTASPTYKLDVQGTNVGAPLVSFVETSTDAGRYSQLEFQAGNRFGYIWLANENSGSWAGPGGLNIYTSSGNIDLWTSGSQKVRIDTSGNVGIGTTNPVSKLTVKSPGEVGSYGEGFVLQRNVNTAKLIRMYESSADGFLEVRTGADDIISKISGYSGTPTFFLSNVGIGTSSPSQKLDVIGQAAIGSGAQAIIGTDGTYAGYSTIGFGGTTNGYNRVFGNNGTGDGLYLSAATGNGIWFWTNGSNLRMHISPTGLVGIGTSIPSQLLHVNGRALVDQFQYTKAISYNGDLNSLLTAGFYDGSGMTNAPNTGWFYVTVETHHGSTDWIHQTATSFGAGNTANEVYTRVREGGTWGAWKLLGDAGSVSGTTNYVAKFTSGTAIGNSQIFDNGTNVGIGTTSPAAKLTVVGDGSGAALMGSAGFGSNYTGLSLNGTLNTGSYNLLSSPNDNHLYINRPSGNDIYFRMANSDQAVIKNSGLVGIGTTNPDSTLHVNTTGGAVGGIKLTSSTNTNGAAYLAQNAGGTSYFGRNNVTGGSFGGTAYSTVIYSSGAYPMEFYTNDTERMRIAANGNVGIGTTYTDGLISGTEKVLKVSNSNIASIYLESAGNGIWANYINPARSLVWYDITADAERMRITSAGNVGIGTTTPAYKLDIVGDIRLPENNYLYFGNTSNFIRRDSSNILTVAGSSSVYLTTSGSTRVAVMGSGDVGIGTTSPDVKLHVVGTSFVPTTMKLVHSQSFGAPQTLSLSSNSTGVSSLDLSFANPFAINIGGSEMMRIAANGSVGVGTTAPDTSSIMDLSSRRQGFLPPRMTNSEMNSIGSPATGLIVYDTTNNKVTVYNGSSWVPLH
jgi:hypothetical protein